MTVTTAIERAAAVLEDGGIVCFATETSYGLAVDISNLSALCALTELKERAQGISVITDTIDRARRLSSVWPPTAARLAQRYWPGPLTLVVPAHTQLLAQVTHAGTVAVRVPAHPQARALAGHFAGALTATSANPRQQPPAFDIATARAYFGQRVALYLDNGPLRPRAPTTLARCLPGRPIEVLRQGELTID